MEMHHQGEEGDEICKSFVGTIFWRIQKLTAPLFKPFGPRSQPTTIHDDDLGFLERKLERIRATLRDSERLEIVDESVKLWLSELRDIESCIEDIIEELEFESRWKSRMAELKREQRRKSTSAAELTGKRKRRELNSVFSSCPRKSLHRKIENLQNLYSEIASDRKALRLREGDGQMRRHDGPRLESTSLPAEGISDFYGRKNELEEVFCSLFSEASHQNDFSVIAIVGMAGVGKTALTQHVFNHNKVNLHFDERIWICMSEGLNVEKVARNIRDNLVEESHVPSEPSLDLLQKDVVNQLRRKRFLLVLDDVWNEELQRSFWEEIKKPLKVGASGSRVIVTTRDRRVASIMGVTHTHYLSCLSNADCWLIFQKHAFDGQQHEHPEMAQLSEEITKNCKGLPLAAKALGYLLRIRFKDKCLGEVLQSDLFCLDEFKNEILPILRLSYDHLPSHLKHCFHYCSLFPKDYIFEKDQLVWLWMAQGLVELKERSKLEDTASKYVDELEKRTLIQYYPREQRYVVHDLFQELAQFVAGHEFLKTLELCEVHKKTRHSSLVPHDLHGKEDIELKLTEERDLRSLLFISRHGNKTPFHVKIQSDLFQFLHCLRVLDLSNTDTEELPVSIGNLIHLRYLSLRNTKIRRLPESLCCLFKLQTLDLRQCHNLEDLPDIKEILPNLHVELPVQHCSKIDVAITTQKMPIRVCMNAVGYEGQGTC